MTSDDEPLRPVESSDDTQSSGRQQQLDALARQLQADGLMQTTCTLREEFFAEVFQVLDDQIRTYNHPAFDRHELLAEFSLGVIKGLPSFRFDSPVERWLRVILAHAYHNVVRKNVGRSVIKRNLREEAIQDYEHLEDCTAKKAFDAVWLDARTMWRAAFDVADDTQSRILTMRFGSDMKFRTIAEHLNLSEDQVRYQLRLVFEAVRAKFKLKTGQSVC
jgi:RNA polymerase sigma factor (sigma-70 family)